VVQGVDPYRFMQDVAGRLHRLQDPAELERLLDELEYLMDALDPEMQEPAYELVARLRDKLELPR
jgi:hypothetical protein